MSLMDNCIKALGEEAVVLSKKETDDLFNELIKQFSFTRWGRIDWTTVEHKRVVTSPSEVLPFLLNNGKEISEVVFILWDQVKLPAMKSNVHTVLSHIEEITMVSFDTWIFCPTERYVIEFYHEGDITIGLNRGDV